MIRLWQKLVNQMTKFMALISRYCPNGIKYDYLGNICNILDNQRRPVTRNNRTSGIYPYYGANGIQDYVDSYIFDGTFLLMGEDGSVINIDHTPILTWAVGKIWVNNHAHVLSETSKACLRFVYYALQTVNVSNIVRGVPPKINQENMCNIKIPIPPLPVQQEIVRMLDSFTDLNTELNAELDARHKQYEYYRDKLLTFKPGAVEFRPLEDVVKFLNGKAYRQSELLSSGKYKILRVGNFYSNDSWYYSDLELDEDKYCTDGDLLYTWAATIGPKIWHGDKVIFHYHIWKLIFDENVLDKYFLYYVLQRDVELIGKSLTHSTMPHVSMENMNKRIIPIPSLTEQRRIVNILKKFDTLCNDTTCGLPAEIAARQKQYEYYRDKLLTFKELKA